MKYIFSGGLTISSIVAFLLIAAFSTYCNITYDIEIGGRLKRAADANTVELAEQELNAALINIEKRRLMMGSTHILWETPDTDLDFWYSNLKESRDELRKLPNNASSLERSNMLMKLRETILDSDEIVTQPPNVSVYPHHKTLALVSILNIVVLFCSAIILFVSLYTETGW